MSIKKEQMFWLLLATFFTGAMLFFLTDSSTITGIAWGYTAIVGIFVGLDLATMVKKTSELPSGKYKEMNKHRYITALILFALLLVEAFIINSSFERNVDGLYASFGMGFLVIIGGLVAGVECNKLVTDKPHEKEAE